MSGGHEYEWMRGMKGEENKKKMRTKQESVRRRHGDRSIVNTQNCVNNTRLK